MKEVNTMSSHDKRIHNKNKKNLPKKLKSEYSKAEPSEDGRTYGIDHLNLGNYANDSESESK